MYEGGRKERSKMLPERRPCIMERYPAVLWKRVEWQINCPVPPHYQTWIEPQPTEKSKKWSHLSLATGQIEFKESQTSHCSLLDLLDQSVQNSSSVCFLSIDRDSISWSTMDVTLSIQVTCLTSTICLFGYVCCGILSNYFSNSYQTLNYKESKLRSIQKIIHHPVSAPWMELPHSIHPYLENILYIGVQISYCSFPFFDVLFLYNFHDKQRSIGEWILSLGYMLPLLLPLL